MVHPPLYTPRDTHGTPTVVHTRDTHPGIYTGIHPRDTHPGIHHCYTLGIPTRAYTPVTHQGYPPGHILHCYTPGYPPGHTPPGYTPVTHPGIHHLGYTPVIHPGIPPRV